MNINHLIEQHTELQSSVFSIAAHDIRCSLE